MRAQDPDLARLAELREETLRRAWGPRSDEERRRIAAAARIFGRQFEEQSASRPDITDDQDARRLLMAVIQGSIEEFAREENMSEEAAADFLGDVTNRDHILEFNEVLEIHETGDTGKTLDELLLEAIENRLKKARWADHWSSG